MAARIEPFVAQGRAEPVTKPERAAPRTDRSCGNGAGTAGAGYSSKSARFAPGSSRARKAISDQEPTSVL